MVNWQLSPEEQVQLEPLRQFWKQNGLLIGMVLLGSVLCFFALTGLAHWKETKAQQSAVLFDAFEKNLKNKDLSGLERSFTDLKTQAGSSAWTARAALLAAQAFQAQKQPALAKDALAFAAENAKDDGYAALARLRLSALLIEEKQYDAALRCLEKGSFPSSFKGLVADRKADIYVQKGETAQAKDLYQKALGLLNPNTPYHLMVQIKLLHLAPKPQ